MTDQSSIREENPGQRIGYGPGGLSCRALQPHSPLNLTRAIQAYRHVALTHRGLLVHIIKRAPAAHATGPSPTASPLTSHWIVRLRRKHEAVVRPCCLVSYELSGLSVALPSSPAARFSRTNSLLRSLRHRPSQRQFPVQTSHSSSAQWLCSRRSRLSGYTPPDPTGKRSLPRGNSMAEEEAAKHDRFHARLAHPSQNLGLRCRRVH